jgi:hypothetical protein
MWAKNRIILRKLQAVYEGGVLRPVDPLPLGEHQLVGIVILDDNPPEDDLKFEPPARFEPLADHGVSLETVRRALSRLRLPAPFPGFAAICKTAGSARETQLPLKVIY